MPVDKYYKTIEELRIIQMEERKLKITNKEQFKKVLSRINYFDIFNGFETLLLKDQSDKTKGYLKHTNFKTFIQAYDFDRKLSTIILKILGDFEVSLKTKISHYFSEVNSNTNPPHLNYLDKNYYKCPAITSYEGKLISDAYQKDKFVLFKKYKFDSQGKYYYKANGGNFTYIDYIKNVVPYIKRYNFPPLWVLIKQFTLGDLFIMVGLLQKNILDKLLKDYNLKSTDREYFLNCLNVFKELRNHCAHMELINRFRTKGNMNLKIIGAKIKINYKSPKNSTGDMYRIPLLDTLKILKTYCSIDEVLKHINNFYYINIIKGRKIFISNLLNRMGSSNIKEWKKLRF